MSLAERVGQLLMVDCPTTYVADATVAAITQNHVGSVILDGTSQLGVSGTARLTTRLENANPSAAELFIATDQEGGVVQRLQGPGFTRIPSALQQGQRDPATLRAQAKEWAGELRQAGVNVNLGPVLDTVPAGFGPNPPIGDLDREYGHTVAAVTSHGVAVALGMASGGVEATIKHFPGLGRVAGNTDNSSGVTDSVTTRHDPYLDPFEAGIRAGAPFVMMSTAIYSKIDPDHPAAFSSIIIGGMLRGDLGFTGVVISDDLGGAAQVSGYGVGRRAVDFIQAGGDIVLTVDASQAAEMTRALLAKASSDPAFLSKVNAAALVVLQAKQARGLLD
jgi:beta-N-acetylhexosaminidase